MSEEVAQVSVESTRKRLSRAFRPLTYWITISIIILVWDYHRKHAPLTTLRFDVRIDGKSAHPSAYSATLGTWTVEPGSVVPIGWRKFRVSMPDAGVFEKRLFVWYGENIVGDVPLEWNLGVLNLKIEPLAKYVHLAGPHYTFSLTNTFGKKVSIPVGNYNVSAVFDRLSEQHEIVLGNNETNHFLIRATAGAINLSSQPSGAKYSLLFQGRNAFNVEGNVPATMAGLPIGNYRLRVWRDDYVKEMAVLVKKWETNQIAVNFEYGALNVTSDPDGATIFSAAKELGQTPKTLTELRPGAHRFRLEKPGFAPVEINADIDGTNTISISTNLVNLRYIQAMAAARRELSDNSPDYRKALASVEQALSESPADAEALALKSLIEAGLPGQVGREAQQALIARKRAAKQAFDQTISSIPQTELYDAHFWELRAPLTKVREALLRTITKTIVKWNMGKEVRVDDETLIFYGTSKGILSSGKRFVILASQIESDLVHVHLKFWDYTMATSRAIPPYQGQIDVPLHPKFFIPEEAANIEARRREIPANVRSVLQKELQ